MIRVTASIWGALELQLPESAEVEVPVETAAAAAAAAAVVILIRPNPRGIYIAVELAVGARTAAAEETAARSAAPKVQTP